MRAKIITVGLVLLLAVPALADWDDGMPSKWVQYPDLSTFGIDVNATEPYVLADDFECRMTGPITDIHLWASWYHDILPEGDPHNVIFRLSIHKDIPADQSPTGYSMPGELLWFREFQPGEFVARIWQDQILEGWMDPPDLFEFPGDTVCWQYNFYIDEADAYVQEGTEEVPMVYWLDVQAMPLSAEARFGWKTSIDHWNDNAVWGQGVEPYNGPWYELYYPPGHELMGQQIDLAFVITTTEPHDELDWGDAPDQPYPTYAINNGANHVIVPGVFMGATVDPDPDGQPIPPAMGDDLDGNDDEDGVTFSAPITPGGTVNVTVTASVPGYLNAWFDMAADGSWAQPGDQIANNMPLVAGVNNLTFILPGSAPAGALTYSRFRFTTGRVTNPTYVGPAPDGEVEDYENLIEEEHFELDWGDAPDPTYPTYAVNNGANHIIVPNVFLGALIDAELNGQPAPPALGDDITNLPDEDGVAFTSPLIPNNAATVAVTASVPGFLSAWIDFAGDGSWAQATDQIFNAQPLAAGVNNLAFNVPPTAVPGAVTYARFRFTTVAGAAITYTGQLPDGEVEDYEVYIEEEQFELDWGDAPDPTYPTLAINGGANHIIVANIFLGGQIDAEADGQPVPPALGDDVNGLADEDGVIFTSPMIPGNVATVDVIASVAGTLNAWIDFAGDGSWAQATDQIFNMQPLAAGLNNLNFTVPASAAPGVLTYARFRFTSPNGIVISYTGQAPDGEVEDYEVIIEEEEPERYKFEFSLDIGSDKELSDPFMDGDEAFDPGDVYWWKSLPVVPPGRDGFKDDMTIFGQDPSPNPPDPTFPPSSRVPVGTGGIPNYAEFFDLDGHDQLELDLVEIDQIIPPNTQLEWPVPFGPMVCLHPVEHLMMSFDDDMGDGWAVPAVDVPVTAPSMAGVSSYGATFSRDEIVGVAVDPLAGWPMPMKYRYPIADEMTVHQSLAPNPDGIEEEDDDVDSLDVVESADVCPYWYFSADHEAFLGLDPGDVYQVTTGGPVRVVDDVIHLGIPDETDVDAFEFVVMEEPDVPGQYYFAIIFSVDNDDALTPADESGGMDPTVVYASFFTGYSFPITESMEDDIDALTCYREPLAPYLCGDANCDGIVDVFDIDAFVLAITNPAAYQAMYPCYMNCDTNCDGIVDVFDIDTFVAAVTGTPCDCGY